MHLGSCGTPIVIKCLFNPQWPLEMLCLNPLLNYHVTSWVWDTKNSGIWTKSRLSAFSDESCILIFVLKLLWSWELLLLLWTVVVWLLKKVHSKFEELCIWQLNERKPQLPTNVSLRHNKAGFTGCVYIINILPRCFVHICWCFVSKLCSCVLHVLSLR